MNVSIPESTAERLNALMRPADEVLPTAVGQGILAAIHDEQTPEARRAALAYVFETKPWAYWSGPKTPPSGFPKPRDPRSSDADREALLAVLNDRDFGLQLMALTAQLRVDRPDATERAKRALAFLEQHAKTPAHRISTIEFMLESDAFLVQSTPPREIKFDEVLPDDEVNPVLWKHRGRIAEAKGAFDAAKTDAIKTTIGAVWAADHALNSIEDERERAIVRGWFTIRMASAIAGSQVAMALSASIHDLFCGGREGA
ncbi:MAG: hypothetical protein Q8Q85_10380 [Gemmatimonadales bacterium]|nr:hypothetical protein [Gemmatimonadales bacterium]